MKRYSLVLISAFVLVVLSTLPLLAQPDTNATAGPGGIPNAFKTIDDRAIPFLSRWTVCEAQVQKIVQQYFKTVGKDPGPDLAKISIWGEPKKNGKYDIYQIKCGSAIAVKKELADNMLQGVNDLIAEPVGPDGEEKYCHDFVAVSNVGGKVTSDIEKKVGVGENNFRMPTGGRQYYSLSVFDQMLRVGATNWWIHNTIGNDNAGYHFWYAGEAKITATRSLIDNGDNNTRRAIPNLLKLSGGIVYRLNDDVGNQNPRLTDFLGKRKLNMGPEPKIAVSFEGVLPLGEDNKTNVFGARINAEIPVQRVNEGVPLAEPISFSRVNFDETSGIGRSERLQLLASHPRFGDNPQFVTNRNSSMVDVQTITPLLRTVAQASLFYTWWLEVEGAENPPDNIFRVDAGINYMEVVETALVQTGGQFGPVYFASANNVTAANRGGRGLVNYAPQNVLDWLYLKFEYRNETTYPFGFTLQYSNQTFMGIAYLPLFGNWLYLEAKYAHVLRELRPYEQQSYFMISPVFRILIPR